MASTTRGNSSSDGEPYVKETPYRDVEQHALAEDLLRNTTVRNISWSGVTVTVKDRETKQPKIIVDNVEGYVEAGEHTLTYPSHSPYTHPFHTHTHTHTQTVANETQARCSP